MSVGVLLKSPVATAATVVAKPRPHDPQWGKRGAPELRESVVIGASSGEPFEQRCLRGAGSLAGVEVHATRKYAGNIREQIRFICAHQMPAGTGRERQIGHARREQIRRDCEYLLVVVLRQCAQHSGDMALRIDSTTAFAAEHLVALCAYFGRKRLKSSTIHRYLSSLRKFMTLLGRRHLVPNTDELMLLIIEFGIDVDLQMRSYTAFHPLCWSAHVNLTAVFEVIRSVSPHAHFLCRLCLAFGLRLSEVLRLRPSESDGGDVLHVERGTKGNRPRDVPLSSDADWRAEQRRLLDEAKRMCEGAQHLGFGCRNLKQARKYFEAVLARCGVTRTQLGITLHGLRHEYAVRRFEELTGLPAPVLRQAPLAAYAARMDAVRSARGQIAAELGHGRAQVASAYLGALPILREEQAKAQNVASRLAERAPQLRAMQIATLSVIVRKVGTRRHEIVLFVRSLCTPDADTSSRLAGELKTAVSRWLGRRVEVRILAEPAQAGACAVLFHAQTTNQEQSD